MIEYFDAFVSSRFVQLLDFLADSTIIFAAVSWIIGRTAKRFHLKTTNKTYSIQRKGFNIQTVTNEISRVEAGGGNLPPEIREEIITLIQNYRFKVVANDANDKNDSNGKANKCENNA